MTHRWIARALALSLLLLTTLPAPAATVTTTWIGGTGNWTDPTHWSAAVPRNTATDSFDAKIDGGNAAASEVTLDTHETIGALAIDAGDQLAVTPTGRLTLEGSSLVNAGQIVLLGAGDQHSPQLVANAVDAQLSGAGSVRLEGGALIGSESLANLDNLISGWGKINGGYDYSGGFLNYGVVEAGVAGEVLLQTGSGANYGTMRAVDGGSLYLKADGGGPNFVNYATVEALDGSTVSSGDGFDSRSGTITALRNSAMFLSGNFGNTEFVTDEDSEIHLAGAQHGGIGNVTFDGQIYLNSSGLSGTITNLGVIRGSISHYGPTTIVNRGEIFLSYVEGAQTVNEILTFTGGGLVTLGTEPSYPVYRSIQNVDNEMRGFGTMGLLQNGGVVEAAGGTLVVHDSLSLEHTGLFAAAPGGVLEMEANVTGSGAWRADGGTIHVTGNVATTGDVNVRNGGALVVDSQMSLGDLVVDSTGSLDIDGILRVAGDVDVDGGNETRFGFGPGSSLEIAGAGGAAIGDWANWQFLEATGIDLFLQPVGGGGAGFYLPKLVIGPDGRLVFRDLRDNGNKPFPEFSGEEVWVGTLEFADSLGRVNLNGIQLHYNQLIGSPDQIIDVPVPEPELAWLLAAALGCGLAARRRAES